MSVGQLSLSQNKLLDFHLRHDSVSSVTWAEGLGVLLMFSLILHTRHQKMCRSVSTDILTPALALDHHGHHGCGMVCSNGLPRARPTLSLPTRHLCSAEKPESSCSNASTFTSLLGSDPHGDYVTSESKPEFLKWPASRENAFLDGPGWFQSTSLTFHSNHWLPLSLSEVSWFRS